MQRKTFFTQKVNLEPVVSTIVGLFVVNQNPKESNYYA